MRIYILICLLVCLLVSCQTTINDKNCKCNQIENLIVTEIINEIIKKDSLFFNENYPFCNSLMSYYLDTMNNDYKIVAPPGAPCVINIRDFNKQLSSFVKSISIDSICLVSQIEQTVNKKLDTIKTLHQLFINSDSIRRLLKTRGKINFYQFYYPLFNNDRTFVYIQYDHICSEGCGQGKTMILKKNLSEWKIVYAGGRWIN